VKRYDIIFSEEAKNTIEEICEFVESLNTSGSGLRFYNKFLAAIRSKFHPNLSYALCKNHWLAEMNLHCVSIGKWIIAFKQQKNVCVIHYILHGSIYRLPDSRIIFIIAPWKFSKK
jgi:hypothetical protein